jgi:hypothetical protein
MKKLFTLIVIAVLSTANLHAGWWDKAERERRIQVEEQLHVQRQTTGNWQVAAGVLAVSAVMLLIIGAAIGSKARRDANK